MLDRLHRINMPESNYCLFGGWPVKKTTSLQGLGACAGVWPFSVPNLYTPRVQGRQRDEAGLNGVRVVCRFFQRCFAGGQGGVSLSGPARRPWRAPKLLESVVLRAATEVAAAPKPKATARPGARMGSVQRGRGGPQRQGPNSPMPRRRAREAGRQPDN